MSLTPGHPSPVSPRQDALRGLLLLVALMVGLATLFADRSDSADMSPSGSPLGATAMAPPEAEQSSMPDVSGLRLDEAKLRLYDFEEESGVTVDSPQSQDLSPNDRSSWNESDWAVVVTRPAAGEAWTEGMTLQLFVLRAEEYEWFSAHPTMPAIPKHAATDDLTGHDGVLSGMSELIEYRYAPGLEPEFSYVPHGSPSRIFEGFGDDPSVEPYSERRERDGLAQATEYGTLTVDSLPAVGSALRVGQLLVVTVRDEPRRAITPTANSAEAHVSVGPDNPDAGDDIPVMIGIG